MCTVVTNADRPHANTGLLDANLGSAIDAKLHTAVSSGEVYSTISVHRLLHLMVPRFCWLDFELQLSLNSMYGLPVSICASRMAYQSFWAGIVLMARPSLSYLQCSVVQHTRRATITIINHAAPHDKNSKRGLDRHTWCKAPQTSRPRHQPDQVHCWGRTSSSPCSVPRAT